MAKKKTIIAFKCVLWLVVIFSCIYFPRKAYYKYSKEWTVFVPVETEIDRAIQVKEAKNSIIIVKKLVLGGGVGVGMGGPQITAKSAEQFVELVPPAEPVYTCLSSDGISITISYMSFIENRSGVVIYDKTIIYQEDGHKFWVKDFDESEITFEWDNHTEMSVLCFILLCVIITFGVILNRGISLIAVLLK